MRLKPPEIKLHLAFVPSLELVQLQINATNTRGAFTKPIRITFVVAC